MCKELTIVHFSLFYIYIIMQVHFITLFRKIKMQVLTIALFALKVAAQNATPEEQCAEKNLWGDDCLYIW